MEKNINENDLQLEYPDFNKLYVFSSEIRKAPKDTLLGVSKPTFGIYLTTFILSVIFCAHYLISQTPNNIQNVLMSVGASGIGAALLGYFIDVAMTSSERNRKVRESAEPTSYKAPCPIIN